MGKSPKDDKLPAEPHQQEGNDELFDIDAFCAEVSYDEIDLSNWQTTHSSLDLEVCLCLSALELSQGCTKVLEYTRTISTRVSGRRKETRDKQSVSLTISPGSQPGERKKLEGKGDQLESQFGDLTVIYKLT